MLFLSPGFSIGTKPDFAVLKWEKQKGKPWKRISGIALMLAELSVDPVWVHVGCISNKTKYPCLSHLIWIWKIIFSKRGLKVNISTGTAISKLIHSRWDRCLLCDSSKEKKSDYLHITAELAVVTYGYENEASSFNSAVFCGPYRCLMRVANWSIRRKKKEKKVPFWCAPHIFYAHTFPCFLLLTLLRISSSDPKQSVLIA